MPAMTHRRRIVLTLAFGAATAACTSSIKAKRVNDRAPIAAPADSPEPAQPDDTWEVLVERRTFQSASLVTLVLPHEYAAGEPLLVTNRTAGAIALVTSERLERKLVELESGETVAEPAVLRLAPWSAPLRGFFRHGLNDITVARAEGDDAAEPLARAVTIADLAAHGPAVLGAGTTAPPALGQAFFWSASLTEGALRDDATRSYLVTGTLPQLSH